MARTEHVNVLIVGSGPAGSTYARTIADLRPGARILIAEVGPRLGDGIGEHAMNVDEEQREAMQLLAQGPDAGIARPGLSLELFTPREDGSTPPPFIFPGLYLVGERAQADGEWGLPVAAMSSGVGGMGVHWGGSAPRPTSTERIDLFGEDELDALYGRAEQLLRVSADLHGDDELLPDLRAALAAEFDADAPGGPQVGFMASAVSRQGSLLRVSGTEAILGDVLTRDGVELRPDTLVRRITVRGGVAVGADLLDRTSGEAYSVEADRVVVCADSLRTPQLLFASGVRPRALGHHLNDHFQVVTFAKLREEFVRPAPEGLLPTGSIRIPFIAGVRPMQGQVVALSRSNYQLPIADLLGGFMSLDELAIMPWYGAKDIQFSDAVHFSDDETDFYGMPAMNITYTLTATDHRTIEQMRVNCERSAKAVGEMLAAPDLAPGGSSLHYQGTVRMGTADDGTSVCDTYARVWGTEHLYVGGNGLIPTSTACNPTLTNVALAVRAATHLASTL